MNAKKVRYFNEPQFSFVDGKVKIDGDSVSFPCDHTLYYFQKDGMTIKRTTARTVCLNRKQWEALTEDELDKILRGGRVLIPRAEQKNG